MTFYSCQHEDIVDYESDDELYPVELNMSFGNLSGSGTEYAPMNRGAYYTDYVDITNYYQYIIAENVNGKLIVAKIGGQVMDPLTQEFGYISVSSDVVFKNIVTDLRPGNYRIFVFTNSYGGEWTSSYNIGDIVPEVNDVTNQRQIIKYTTNPIRNYPTLFQEVFYATRVFTVYKNTGLTSTPQQSVSLNLERRVTKFRIVFEDNVCDGKNLSQLYNGNLYDGLKYEFSLKNVNGEAFATGLDIWGNLFYGDPTHTRQSMYVNSSRQSLELPNVSSKKYFVVMSENAYYAPYIFSQPGVTMTVNLAETSAPGKAPFFIRAELKDGHPAIYLESIGSETFELKNNGITGIVLRLSDITAGVPDDHDVNTNKKKYLMEPVYENMKLLDPDKLIQDGNFEYRK